MGQAKAPAQFRLKVELDPQPEDLEALEKWPRAPLLPDIATVAAGWIALELDGRPILYQDGKLVPPLALEGVPGDPLNVQAARIGDYVIIFLQRLLDATHNLSDGQAHRAEFGDSSACLWLQQHNGTVRVSYREHADGADAAIAHPNEQAFLAAVKEAAAHYLEELYTINAALREHPDIAAIRDTLRHL